MNTKGNSAVMKRIFPLCLIVILIFVAACNKKSSTEPSDLELMQEQVRTLVDSMWQNYLDEAGIETGGILFHAQSGDNRLFCKTNMPNHASRHSLFRAASVTKTFTASAIMLLHQSNQLSIDDPVTAAIPGTTNPYLPDNQDFAIPFKDQITIRSLLEHRAGVFDLVNFNIPDSVSAVYAGMNWLDYVLGQDPSHQFSIDEIISVIAQHQLIHHKPGAEYSYTNTGYMLLGKIIERVSGMSIEDYFSSMLCLPNGLDNIIFPLDSAHSLPEPRIPSWVMLDSAPISTDLYNMSHEVAQGNLVTDSEDLLSWITKWQKGTAGLSLDTVLEMRQSSYPDQDYGLGTSYMEGFGYGHTGAIAGFLTLTFYDPLTDYSFVLLCNMWNFNSETSFDEQVYTLFDIAAHAKTLITGNQISTKSLKSNRQFQDMCKSISKRRF